MSHGIPAAIGLKYVTPEIAIYSIGIAVIDSLVLLRGGCRSQQLTLEEGSRLVARIT
jgi:hypothetical protein